MAFSERIVKHKSVFEIKHVSHNPPGIKDFDIIKPISKGAFGQVYLARRQGSEKLYALKVMKKLDVLNKNMMEQVVVERDALALSSKSSFVVQLYYSFQNKENIFLVMEYMIGGDLKSLLHNVGFFDENMSKFYVAEVTNALEFLHNHSIYHCDIKPDNMLLSCTGHVKLTDFGLSTLTTGSKLTVLDLVKHNTPSAHISKESTKTSNIFWRTPGQLQSLVTKFTFSSPKPNQRIEKRRFGKINKNLCNSSMEFSFSSPSPRSYHTTPCGLQRNSRYSNSMYGYEPGSKLQFTSIQKEDINERNRKRALGNLNVHKEKENLPKRFCSSLPVDVEILNEQVRSNPERPTVTFQSDLDISLADSLDHEYSVENMSVDTSVFSNNSYRNKNYNSDNTDLSGVTTLSDTSMMSLSSVGDQSRTDVPTKLKSSLKNNDELGFLTPKKNLNFNLDEDDDSTTLCPNKSLHLEDTVTTYHDTPSCDVFDMPFKNQTPFRTPKSCVRGKVSVTEKRNIQGTPDYLAPEILLKREFGAPADWWALGICFYEFVTGVPPFNDDLPELVFEHILAHEMIWPEGEECLTESTAETIKWMLSADPDDRPVASDVKKLSCFSHIKWDNLHNELAPFIPQPDNMYDTTYFDAKNQARQFKMSDFLI